MLEMIAAELGSTAAVSTGVFHGLSGGKNARVSAALRPSAPVSGGGDVELTVNDHCSVPVEFDAVIVAEPTPAATAKPFVFTRTIEELDDDHVIVFLRLVGNLDDNWIESPTNTEVLLPAGGLGRIT